MRILLVLAVVVASVVLAEEDVATPAADELPTVMVEDHTVALGPDNFTAFVNGNATSTMVLFHSPGCPHCTAAMPHFYAAAATFADRPEAIRFAMVDVNVHPHMAERHGVAKLPAVQVFTADGGKGVSVRGNSSASDDHFLPTQTALETLAVRLLHATDASHNVDNVTALVDTVIYQQNKTLVIAIPWLSQQASDDDDLMVGQRAVPSEELNNPCMRAYRTAAMALLDVEFLHLAFTRDEGTFRAAQRMVGTDIKMSPFEKDADVSAECSGHSALVVLKCWSAKPTNGSCELAGGSLPLPVTNAGVIATLATHALPLVGEYTEQAAPLYARSHINRDAGVPQPAHLYVGGHARDDTPPEPRVRPLLVAFLPVKSCAAGANTARYVRRVLRTIAVDFPAVAFAVLDEYAHAAAVLRLGFKRKHVRDQVAMGILANGFKYSMLPLLEANNQTDAFNATLVRQFVSAFVAGEEQRYYRSQLPTKAQKLFFANVAKDAGQEPTDAVLALSGIELESWLFREGEKAPISTAGGVNDLVLVALTDSYSKNNENTKWAVAQLQAEAAALQRADHESVARRREEAGSDRFADMDVDAFLEPNPQDVAARELQAAQESAPPIPPHLLKGKRSPTPASTPCDEDDGDCVAPASAPTNGTAEALKALRVAWVDGDANDLPLEQLYPMLKDNHLPVLFAARRRSLVAHSADRGPVWDVRVARPAFFQFMTYRLSARGPTVQELGEFVAAVGEDRSAEEPLAVPRAREE